MSLRGALLSGGLFALLLGAATITAHADPLTIRGTYSVSYTSAAGNDPSVHYDRHDPKRRFTLSLAPSERSLAPNDSRPTKNFFTVEPASHCGCSDDHDTHYDHHRHHYGDRGTASGTLGVTFSLTDDGGLDVTTATANATYTADYGNQTDSVTWAGASPNGPPARGGENHSKPSSYGSFVLPVTFADGASLAITLFNAADWGADWGITPTIRFMLRNGPAAGPTQDPPSETSVPEPGSLALLATGLFGLGFVILRRRAHEVRG